MNFKELNRISEICTQIMRCDQYPLQKRLHRLHSQLKKGQAIDPSVFEQLIQAIEKSNQQRQHRALHLPKPQFPEDLPISARREEIATTLAEHQAVIIAGETGSGKTTPLPKIGLSLGRGVTGLIGYTQPRRIAAARVASELESPLGHTVGYKVRFSKSRLGFVLNPAYSSFSCFKSKAQY